MGLLGVTITVAFIAAAAFLFGALPVFFMLREDYGNSIHGMGAARRYLAALDREAKLRPGDFQNGGVSIPPWVALGVAGGGSGATDKWKANMVEAIARIAPDNVSITESGTCIQMSPKA